MADTNGTTYKTPVNPGEQLGYVDKLKERDLWPPKRSVVPPSKYQKPAITPYVVVTATLSDRGVRPIADDLALYNQQIQILDSSGNLVLTPSAGETYAIRATVANRGACGCFGGLTEFYVAPAAIVDQMAGTPGATLKALGYAGFAAGPGATVQVNCPHTWTPVDAAEAASSIVVQAYDAFLDRVQQGFNARQDRHVGRRDYITDFAGVWEGLEFYNNFPSKIRIIIAQDGLAITASIYAQVQRTLPGTPQETGTGTVAGGMVQMDITETVAPNATPFTANHWIFSITPAGMLHFTCHRHFLEPGDTRPDQDSYGDLPRA